MVKQFFKWVDKRTKQLRWWDIAFLKLAMVFVGLWLAVMFPETVWSYEPSTYLVLFALTAIVPVYGFYFRK